MTLRKNTSSEVDRTLAARLHDTFTDIDPLGPSDHDLIDDGLSESILYESVSPFQEVAPHQRYLVLLGRKGSGKSAMLADLRAVLRQKKDRGRTTQSLRDKVLPDPGGSLVFSVESWKHFHSLALTVASRDRNATIASELVPPEYYTSLWLEVLWDELIKNFFDYAISGRNSTELAAVRRYVNEETDDYSSSSQAAHGLFSEARQEILRLLQNRRTTLYYLFDSMEKYPIRNPVFCKVLSGFFQALVRLNAESPRLQVHFCLPEEIERHVTRLSAAVLKSFSSSFRIRWKPVDLLRIVAHRYRLLAFVRDITWYKRIRSLDFRMREDLHSFFSQILPRTVKNRLGIEEDPLAYIVRHTQLLPRHTLAYFNAVINRSWEASGGFREISEEALREGVSHIQSFVAREILVPYEAHYPDVIDCCAEILPDLSPISSYAELRRHEGRFSRRIEEDVTDVWRTLFDMGILGRVIPSSAVESSKDHPAERYCYGAFHYNSFTDFGLATDAEYCFHPAFSGAFGMLRRNNDLRLVYPANIEMLTLGP